MKVLITSVLIVSYSLALINGFMFGFTVFRGDIYKACAHIAVTTFLCIQSWNLLNILDKMDK